MRLVGCDDDFAVTLDVESFVSFGGGHLLDDVLVLGDGGWRGLGGRSGGLGEAAGNGSKLPLELAAHP